MYVFLPCCSFVCFPRHRRRSFLTIIASLPFIANLVRQRKTAVVAGIFCLGRKMLPHLKISTMGVASSPEIVPGKTKFRDTELALRQTPPHTPTLDMGVAGATPQPSLTRRHCTALQTPPFSYFFNCLPTVSLSTFLPIQSSVGCPPTRQKMRTWPRRPNSTFELCLLRIINFW